MFRQMRRSRQLLSQEESIAVLKRGTSGVLAVAGDEGYPYAVPMSYVYEDNKIYFHCARSGHKLDAIRSSEKVSFCVIDQDIVVPEEYVTYYRSVIVFGRARILKEEQEIRRAVELLAVRYCPEAPMEQHKKEIDAYWDALCMVVLEAEHITGKAAKAIAGSPVGDTDGKAGLSSQP